MRVIGISGSPRRGGNSEALLKHALEPFLEKGWSVTEFQLSTHRISSCAGCESCTQTGVCAQHDDMDAIYEEFAHCDAVIIASPVYYRNVTAQLKSLFDRSYAQHSARPLAGKAAGAIAVGRGTDGGQSIVLNIIYNFFLSSSAYCVPGELNGVSAAADKPGDILAQPNRLKQARILGENVLRLAESLRC